MADPASAQSCGQASPSVRKQGRFIVNNRWIMALCALLLGGLATLGFAPFSAWPCALIALVGLLYLWDGAGAKRAFSIGFLFGFGHFLSGIYWLYIAVHTIGSAPVWLAVMASLVLIAYLSLYTGVLGYLTARWGGGRMGPRNALLLVPAGWAFLELVRGTALTGFPWLSLGYAFTGTPLSGFAPLGGVHSVGWIAALAAGGLWLLLRGPARLRVMGAGAVVAIVVSLLVIPEPTGWTQQAGRSVSVAVVQGNIPQKKKWLPSTFKPTLKRYYRLSEKTRSPSVLVWPEAAIPAVYQNVKDTYVAALRKLMQAHDQTLVFGVLGLRPGKDDKLHYYNTAHIIGNDHGLYAKRHLVPFGEYFPVPDFVRHWLASMHLPSTNISPGAPHQKLPTIAGEPVGLSICYEDLFGNEMRRDLPKARWLINITNDAWFGRTVGRSQHLEVLRMRALEDGRYVLRAANTGISALISPAGTVVERAPSYQAVVMKARMSPRVGATPYVEVGNLPVWMGSGLALLLVFALSIRERFRR